MYKIGEVVYNNQLIPSFSWQTGLYVVRDIRGDILQLRRIEFNGIIREATDLCISVNSTTLQKTNLVYVGEII